tara:strand:- start:30 stop:872 length:843 start_codon:yes stop_codon:yes gene_type:complete
MSPFFTKNEVKIRLNKSKNKSLGLVPTMGSLHEGHLSLIETATKENDLVWVSIFLNPTQFDKKNDLINYPKNLNKDIKLIKSISNNINIFSPSEFEMYGDKIISKVYNFKKLDSVLEGKHRKNHFNGVATIVSKLLHLFKPKNVYFGEKDYQQVLIIKDLINIEKIKVKLILCPTVREKNGLALSSRNKLLSSNQRNSSSIIYNSLKYVSENLYKSDFKSIKKNLINKIEKINSFKVEYLEIADANTLEICDKINPKKTYRAFICVSINKVRLIDNILLN